MKATVFGGSGFLGSHVVDSLAEKGYNVTVFDVRQSEYGESEMLIGDILDKEKVDYAVKGADYVYNFAGLADLEAAADMPSETVKLNILGNCYIMDACVKHNVKRFIYASTFYVHSEKGGFYRCSKQASEIYIEEYYSKYKLPYTILRYGSLYGPRADTSNGVYRNIYSALKHGKITYSGTGDEMREYIHVKDASILSVKILGEEYENKHIIITGSVPYRVSDMFRTIEDIIGKPIEKEYTGSDGSLHYNITPYQYKPKYSYKLTSNFCRDLGQGLFECIDEIGRSIEGEQM